MIHASTNGLLLAGGFSRRYGSDKREVLYRGRTLAARAFSALSAAVSGEVFVAAGQPARRPAGLPNATLLADAVPDAGPLGGIVAGLSRSRRGLLVLACDLPLVRDSTLLVVAALGVRLGRPVAPRGPSGLEPLAAYYPGWTLKPLEAGLRERILAPHLWLERLGCLAVEGLEPGQFANINRPKDLADLGGRKGRRRP